MASYPAHEGLQVVSPDSATNAPQVINNHQAPKVYTRYDAAPELAPPGCVSDTKVEPNRAEPYWEHASTSPRRYCGLRARTALLLAIAIAIILIGAIVGGVVGGLKSSSNSGKNNSSPAATSTSATSTSTTATSTSSAFPTPTNGVLALNCPAINNTQYTSQDQTFYIYCLTDFQSKSGNVAQSLQPSINGCIDSCADYNANSTSPPCQGLTFGANITRYSGANCFLKTGPLTKTVYTIDDFQAGAVLLG